MIQYNTSELKKIYRHKKWNVIDKEISNMKKNLNKNKYDNKLEDIYPNIDDPEYFNKMYNKMEFVILNNNPDNEDTTNKNIINTGELRLMPHQLFIRNFLSVHTPYNKVLLYHSVGTGKTLSAWGASKTFIEEYNKYVSEETPMVYIVGFTEHLFKTEFIKWTELGFVDEENLELLNDLKDRYGFNSQEYIKERSIIFNRLCESKYSGYYKFYGYKELYNKLFTSDDSLDLNNTIMTIFELLEYIKKGNIKVNTILLNDFENSLMVCDEIHNTYNSEDLNNYGLSILYITHNIKNMKTLFMTATPINNSSYEIIDLINLLNDDLNDYVTYEMYDKIFNSKDYMIELEKFIDKKFKGKVSVFENIDMKLYPERDIVGEKIDGIDLLKFIRCDMSDYYFKEYIKQINYNEQTNISKLPNLASIYNDIMLPDALSDDRLILNKSTEWTNKYKITYDDDLSKSRGAFFNIENLKIFSPKYYNMLIDIFESVGKVFIYHNYIYKGGVYMIESILNQNGFIEYDGVPNDYTRCVICNDYMKNHKNNNQRVKYKKNFKHSHSTHEFIPLKYILYTGIIHKNMLRELINLYNFTDNINGHSVKVLIGSKIISEGVTLKEVNDCLITSPPINISHLIQIIGRCTRNSTHLNLPVNRRYVNIRLYVNSFTETQKKEFKSHFNVNYNLNTILTVDEAYYKRKAEEHVTIQFLEKLIKENAIDGKLYPSNSYDDDLGYIYKPLPRHSVSINKKNVDDFTYVHHNYIQDVFEFTLYYIKYLLLNYKVLRKDDIIDFFKSHNYIVEYNTKFINETYIVYILNKLLIYNNFNSYIVNDKYNIEDYYIINIDDYIVLVKDVNNIYSDIFNNYTSKSIKINLLNYVENVDNDIEKIIIKKIEEFTQSIDVLSIFKYEYPFNILSKVLLKTNNEHVKKVLNAQYNKNNTHHTIGFIDKSQKFKVRNKVFDKGIVCNSLKKQYFIEYFNEFLELDSIQLYKKSIKDICIKLRNALFYKNLNSNNIIYFKLIL